MHKNINIYERLVFVANCNSFVFVYAKWMADRCALKLQISSLKKITPNLNINVGHEFKLYLHFI